MVVSGIHIAAVSVWTVWHYDLLTYLLTCLLRGKGVEKGGKEREGGREGTGIKEGKGEDGGCI